MVHLAAAKGGLTADHPPRLTYPAILTHKKTRAQNFPIRMSGVGSMAKGTVKWFNDAKGFGFIEPSDGGADVFAHFSAVQMEGFRTLKQGSLVSYELAQGPKGDLAQNITPLDSDGRPLPKGPEADVRAGAD